MWAWLDSLHYIVCFIFIHIPIVLCFLAFSLVRELIRALIPLEISFRLLLPID